MPGGRFDCQIRKELLVLMWICTWRWETCNKLYMYVIVPKEKSTLCLFSPSWCTVSALRLSALFLPSCACLPALMANSSTCDRSCLSLKYLQSSSADICMNHNQLRSTRSSHSTAHTALKHQQEELAVFNFIFLQNVPLELVLKNLLLQTHQERYQLLTSMTDS